MCSCRQPGALKEVSIVVCISAQNQVQASELSSCSIGNSKNGLKRAHITEQRRSGAHAYQRIPLAYLAFFQECLLCTYSFLFSLTSQHGLY